MKSIKRKPDPNEIVTRKILEEVLEEKLEEKFEEKLRNYPTRDEMNEGFARLNEKFDKYRDEVLTKMDEIIGEFENNRLDRDLAVAQTRDLEVHVDNHEKRIKLLEQR